MSLKRLIFFLWLLSSMSCAPAKLSKNISEAELDYFLQEFTERRFHYNLYKNQVPTNYELFLAIVRENGKDPAATLALFKEKYPTIFRSLFGSK